MTDEQFLRLLEEMVDLKIQQHATTRRIDNPELARLAHQKRYETQARLLEIRNELLAVLRG